LRSHFQVFVLMDLGATASIFAVVSLAGQLGGGVANLLTFLESFKGAPEYVRGIEKDLKLLLPILESISFDEPTYDDILQDCNAKIRNLQDIVNRLEPGFASSHRRIREWTALKTTRKASQIRKFKAVLEEMKSTLLLLYFLSSYQGILSTQRAKLSEASTVNDRQSASAVNNHASTKGDATPMYIPNRFRMIPRPAPRRTWLGQAKSFVTTLPNLLGLTGVVGIGNIWAPTLLGKKPSLDECISLQGRGSPLAMRAKERAMTSDIPRRLLSDSILLAGSSSAVSVMASTLPA
jgi:hypothetical protein